MQKTRSILVRVSAAALTLVGVVTPSAAEEVYIVLPEVEIILSPQEQKARDEERAQKEAAARESARREQQAIDDELTRRGWPKSREGEVRKFIDLQKQAAALRPKPGAGAALQLTDAQSYWEQRRAEVANEGQPASPPTPTPETGTASPVKTAGTKSNCRMVDAPSRVAMGVSRSSESDARSIAMANTKGCSIVAEMNCDSHVEPVMTSRGLVLKDGNIQRGDTVWDCRASYHCGEQVQRCEGTAGPTAASKQ